MIATLKGILDSKTPTEIVIDVQGVGYRLLVPLSTFYKLPEEGEPVRLVTHTHVREDAIQIFGFLTSLEKHLFRMLISVSKVGPKMALSILSGMDAETIQRTVGNRDVAALSSLPGVGKKTAERICMELKDKIFDDGTRMADKAPARGGMVEGCAYRDAVTALVHLGYRPNEVREVLRQLASEKEDRPVEELIRESLRFLSKA